MSIVRKEMWTSCYNNIELGEHTMTTLIKVARSINENFDNTFKSTSTDDVVMFGLTVAIISTMFLAMAPIV